MKSLTVLLLTVLGASAAHAQDLRLARIFGDHMVLQQEKPIHVWGWAAPGAKVVVTLTQDEQAALAAGAQPVDAAASDAYSVTLRYDERNAPSFETRALSARAGDDGRFLVQFEPARASFRPTWILATSGDETVSVRDVLIGEVWVCAGQSNMAWGNFNRKDREAASADFPGLRYIAWHDSDYKPLADVRSSIRWQACSPQTAAGFSAVPYLYGMFLHRYLKVPLGVINVARGGTLGQTWCMREELDALEDPIVRTVLADYDAETATWDDATQQARILAEWEGACAEAQAAHEVQVREAAAAGKPEPRLRMPKKPADPRRGWSPPAGLFNATVLPIRDLGVRGVLYYQGENNNFMRWTRYESTFPRVPASFRRAFRDEALPFGCISQPGWGQHGLDPELAAVAEGYAIVRDIQRRALRDDPHGDLIATYPTGNSYIHPGEKLPVAEYASLWALARVYGKPVEHRGNEYRGLQVRDAKLHLFFDQDPIVFERWKHIENNAAWQVLPVPREGNAEFLGFTIAGADRRWYPAKGRHVKLDGEWTIELTSDLVPAPVAARYGWANWPTGNMVSNNRLPIPTFRTDDWPVPRGMNYSKDAERESKQAIDELKAVARGQALDRKIRQARVDVPRLETELFKGDVEGQLASKVARLEELLDELQGDGWLAKKIDREHAQVATSIQAMRASLEALQAQVRSIGD